MCLGLVGALRVASMAAHTRIDLGVLGMPGGTIIVDRVLALSLMAILA